LTTVVLVLIRVTAIGTGAAGVAHAERIITVVYAVVTVLGAPIDVVLSRFAADRVYERRRDRIAAPLRRVLAAVLLMFAIVGVVAMALLRPPAALVVPGAALATVVGAQWLLLSAAGGLSSPRIILRAFAIGAPVSVLAALALSRPGALGEAGYLYGFGAGQVVTLGMLLWGTLRALPREEDEAAAILPAFRAYWLLAAAAFAFHAGIWVDKLVVYALAGGDTASAYAALAAVAWLSVVPACAYLFVTVETVFHRRFQAFYAALHTGASLPALERLAAELREEVGRTLRGAAAVQVCVTLVCVLLAPAVAPRLAVAAGSAHTLEWLLLGAGAQMLGLAATLLLYYFDFRTEALVAAITQVFANGGLTLLIGAHPGALGAGYAAACGLTCVVAITLLRRRMASLLERTFQSQPYATEG
jgi:uncharacterized membrane protein